MFGGLLLLTIVVTALALMIGRIELARTMGTAVFLVAVLAPLLTHCTTTVHQALPALHPTALVVVILAASLLRGFKKFIDHRRAAHHWVGEPPSSLKQRVEDDL